MLLLHLKTQKYQVRTRTVSLLLLTEVPGTISYQLFWSMIQLISSNQRAVSPEAQPRVIQPSDCEI